MKYSIGIGLTSSCNCDCKFCYASKNCETHLPFGQIKYLCENVELEALNFGTGESALHPEFRQIIRYLHTNNVKMALTTNGYSVSYLSDEELLWFNDIDFSLDFPRKRLHDSIRAFGLFDSVMRGIERCKKLRVEVSIVMCLMNINFKYVQEMLALVESLDVNLRINVYKPVHAEEYKMTFKQFWYAISSLLDNSKLVSCSEPIVNAFIENSAEQKGSPCSKTSFRVRPDGGIMPCVYWDRSFYSIKELSQRSLERFQIQTEEMRIIPIECKNCKLVEKCRGGCLARRLYGRGLENPDEYCPLQKNKKIKLHVEWVSVKDLVHSQYLCTIIVRR